MTTHGETANCRMHRGAAPVATVLRSGRIEMRAHRKVDPECSFWHPLFALGTSEILSPAGQDGPEEVVVFDEAWCEQVEQNWRAYQRASSRGGHLPQPRPVSLMHAIERRLFTAEKVDTHDLRRCGGLVDVRFHRGSDGIPAGIYGLIEWTWEGIWQWDAYAMISPTTVEDWRMRDGTLIPGPSIYAVGLVDVAALENIGTVRDALPASAWAQNETEGVATLGELLGGMDPRYRDAVLRSAASHVQERNKMANDTTATDTPPTEAPAAPEADTTQRADDGDMEKRLADAEKRVADLQKELEDSKEELRKATEKDKDTQRAADAPATPATPAPSTTEAVQQAAMRAQHEATILSVDIRTKEAMEHVRKGRLLPGLVAQYVTRSVDGADVTALLGGTDGTPAGTGAGASNEGGTHPGTAPTPKTVTIRQLREQAGGHSTDPNERAKALVKFKELRAKALADGVLVV